MTQDRAHGFAVALVGQGAEAEAAVTLAGGHVVERIGWGESPAMAGMLVVEAEGVDAATLAAALAGIAAVAADEIPVVVAFGRESIDLVAAALLGGPAVLLCEPDLAERVAAIAVSGRGAGGGAGPAARVREDAVERLRRMNAEVARIAALLAGLVEPAPAAGDTVDDRRATFAVQPVEPDAITAADIRGVIRARRLRDQFFDARLLEDPGWDMLLDLFAAELERAQVSVSSLCIASGVAPTTALRWIGRMAEAGLLVRVPDIGDRRRAFLKLGAGASAAMRAYVAAARRAGLPLV